MVKFYLTYLISCLILMLLLLNKAALANNLSKDFSPLHVEVSGKLALCNHSERGEIILTVKGGSAPYTYQWSTGAETAIISDLNAGTYTVTVTDGLGTKATRTIIIQAPFVLATEMQNLVNASCDGENDGSVDLKILRGRPPFTIVWSHGIENVTQARNLEAGDYMVTVTDYYQCTNTLSFTIGAGGNLEVLAETKDISCDGELGAIALKIRGGEAPYTFEWSHGAESKDLNGLEPGNYEVLIKDAKGCSVYKSFEILKHEAVSLEVVGKNDVTCGGSNNGYIELKIKGGEAPFKIEWLDNGLVNELVRKDLHAGSYAVKVEDKNGCLSMASFEIKEPAPFLAKVGSRIEVDCASAEAKGFAWVQVSGGVGPYHIKWNTGEEGTDEILLSKQGKVEVMVRDQNGCTITQSAEVNFPNHTARLSPTDQKIIVVGKEEFLVDQAIQFRGEIPNDAVSWDWDFGDGHRSGEPDPVHIYAESGEFEVSLSVMNLYGCTSVNYYRVVVEDNAHRLMVPNAFSPNGDGLNDYFLPKWKNITAFEMLIYNTWGELLYTTSGLESEGWNGYLQGRKALPGNYIYLIEYTTLRGEKKIKKGVFTLVK